jgi:choline dehydrogenase-like flavoprotein
MSNHLLDEYWDIVLIGSGAGGLSAAYKLIPLAKSGKKILIIEQGNYYAKDKLPTLFADWEVRRFHQSNIDPNRYLDQVGFPIDNQNNPIAIAAFNAVGGSSVLYSGHFPRFHPSDFQVKSNDGVADDWPITYYDLEPYYNFDHGITPIGGVEGDPSYPEITQLLPPVPLGELGEKLVTGLNELGWHWWPSYSGLATVNFKGHLHCQNLGPCNTGCPFGAKSSDDQYLLPDILESGINLITDIEVSQLVKSYITPNIDYAVAIDSNKRVFNVKSKVFILSAGGVGTPRILLNSPVSGNNTVANSSNLVGKNLMLHPWGHVEGIFEENLNAFYGPQGCFIASHEFHETDSARGFLRGFSMQFQRGASLIDTALRLSARKEIKYGEGMLEKLDKNYNHTAQISIIVEDLPEESNCVLIDKAKESKRGTPGIKINYKLSENSKRNLAYGIKKARELLSVCGAKSTFGFGPIREVGFHIAGTAKMGSEPESSVVNKWCQTHDHPNLFISDSSVFVTSSPVNPLATIHAIGYRTGQYITENFEEIVRRYR